MAMALDNESFADPDAEFRQAVGLSIDDRFAAVEPSKQ
jgi:hypothetical protein